MKLSRKYRRLVWILGFVLIGWTAWLGWQAIRPPSTRYWLTMRSSAIAAQSKNRYRQAARYMERAVAEAKRFGLSDERLGITLVAQGNLLHTARSQRDYISLDNNYWSLKGAADYYSARVEKQFCEHITPEQISMTYQQALQVYEHASSSKSLALLPIYVQFIKQFEQIGDDRQTLKTVEKVITLRHEIEHVESNTLTPLDKYGYRQNYPLPDSETMLRYKATLYAYMRKANGVFDSNTNTAFYDAYICAIAVGEYDQSIQLAKERINDFSVSERYDRRVVFPLAYYAHALVMAGRLAEAEAVFQRGINVCNHEFPRRFFDYPAASRYDLPDEMTVFYDYYYQFLLQTKQKDLARRVFTIVTDNAGLGDE